MLCLCEGVSLDSLCRWQVQVSVYCAWRIPAHLRCTQCSILLHLMDICFLTCICLWRISQIQTFLFKVFLPLTKFRQNNLHSVHTRPCRIYEQSGPYNKQQSTTHGNAPNVTPPTIPPPHISSSEEILPASLVTALPNSE